jgi:transposase
MTAGQVSDYTGAAALLDDMPAAQWLLGDRGYDADWFRDALQAKGIQPCIPGRKIPQRAGPIRQTPLPATQPHRDHVRPPQGMAPRRHSL